MRRRDFCAALALARVGSHPEPPLVLPVYHVVDSRARCGPEQLSYYWSRIWAEAVRDFGYCGIRLDRRTGAGEVRRSAGDRPIFVGLARGVINFVVTRQVPLLWDNGRGLSGITTRYEGYDLCLIALDYAHGHQIPLLSLNTSVHELLHALLGDIRGPRPSGWAGQTREFRIDWYATRLWLFHDGAAIRQAAQAYLRSSRAGAAHQGTAYLRRHVAQ